LDVPFYLPRQGDAPFSASQVIASTVMGVGTAERRKGVRWLIAGEMVMAWLLTIPCSRLLAAMTRLIFTHF